MADPNDPWAWRSDMDAPKPDKITQALLREGPAPTGRDKIFDAMYGWLGGLPQNRATASALTNLFDVGTLGMATGAYDGGRALAETGRPGELAMALMPGSKVARPVEAAANAATKGIRAFHGSPHDFDRFSMDKIGTGEGAQAFGHGLYFAENEGVARQYRDQLSDYNWKDPKDAARGYLTQLNGDRRAAIEAASRQLAEGGLSRGETIGIRGAVDILRSGDAVATGSPGHMYEVRINADPNDFLDWDKPLGEQSEKVRQAVGALGMRQDELDYHLARDERGGFNVIRALRNHLGKGMPEASDALRNAGIKGIRYLDAGSRDAAEGTHNYVVLDDSLIDIMRKYGVLPAGVGGGALAASQATPDERG